MRMPSYESSRCFALVSRFFVVVDFPSPHRGEGRVRGKLRTKKMHLH
jgi:hypothetical protein